MPRFSGLVCTATALLLLGALETSAFCETAAGANPEVNKPFVDPQLKVDEWVTKFEVESREVYKFRKKIVAAVGIKKGDAVADIGAGTGLFTFLFSKAVGNKGQVFAVDISKNFLAHLEQKATAEKRTNIKTVEGGPESPNLEPASVDRIFICDTYHHFEKPMPMLKAMLAALKPKGQLVLVEFKREEGVSNEWTLKHVRAGEKQTLAEFTEAGFKVSRRFNFLKDNYVLVFTAAPVKP
jgi:ubiquinone/menaquinone biosynthesis C-methylase UbiE